MREEVALPKSDNDIINTTLATVTTEQWALLEKLTLAVDPSDPGEWQGGHVMRRTPEGNPVIAMPFYMYSQQLNSLVEALYECNVIVPFNWVDWQGRFEGHLEALSATDSPPTELVKYLVTVVRCDRFSEGYLGNEILSGRFLDNLLAVIRHFRPAAP
jgi:hypothetical protein